MKNFIKTRAFLSCAVLTLAASHAAAHRTWMLPSSSTTSGKDPVVTVDASASEDLFAMDGHPLKLDGLTVTGPDGNAVAVENMSTGAHRSSFDFKPTQTGTYRVSNVSETAFASYKLGGEAKRWRGAVDALAKEIPASAEDVQVTRLHNRVETFVSHEQPGGKAVQASGAGLELQPLGAMTELLAEDISEFRLLLDGRPAADVLVTVVRGGNRYRYKLGEVTLKTDADGRFSVKWPQAGEYWISATVAPPRGETGTRERPLRRVNYSATVEVLTR